MFIARNVFELTAIYFFWPETKNRTFEELTAVFESPNPVKKSLEKRHANTVMHALHIGPEDMREE